MQIEKKALCYCSLRAFFADNDHAIEILADWQAMAQRLLSVLREIRNEDGLTRALEEVSALLVTHFPLPEGEVRRNEAPDAVQLQ